MGKVDSIDYNILSQIFEKIKGMDIIQNAMFSKVNELVENQKQAEKTEVKTVEEKEEEKKKMENIFNKKSIGKPRGTYEEKQQQYFELVQTGRIKNPVQKTLDYYQICRNELGEYIINLLPSS
jgi:uncharacterized radical SAM superfamily protein